MEKVMTNENWITKDELKEVKVQAKEIWEDFCADLHAREGEQTYTEIQVNTKYFDIECYDEACDRTGNTMEMYCNVYPVTPAGYQLHGMEWREMDGTRWIRLFTKGNNDE